MVQIPKYPTTNFAADIDRIVKRKVDATPTSTLGTVTAQGDGCCDVQVDVSNTESGGSDPLTHKNVPYHYHNMEVTGTDSSGNSVTMTTKDVPPDVGTLVHIAYMEKSHGRPIILGMVSQPGG